MTENIALWGYGNHGKDMEWILTQSWSDRFKITAIFDQKFNDCPPSAISGLPVMDPEKVCDYYKQGVFEKVLVTVYSDPHRMAVGRHLLETGIPELELDISNTFQSADYFQMTEPPRPWFQEGYQRYDFQDLYLLKTPPRDAIFIFDKEGTINRTFWQDYKMVANPFVRYYCPKVTEPVELLSGEWCPASILYGSNYWHFTYEVMDRIWLLEKHNYQGRYLLTKSFFAEELLKLIDLDLSRVTWLEAGRTYKIEHLVYLTLPERPFNYAAPVLIDMKEKILSNIPASDKKWPERIYVKRIGVRQLIISQEWLDRHGFFTIIPEELSLTEEIQYFRHAKIVLSPHGANTTNSLYMQPGSVLIETFPCNYVNPCCLETLELQNVWYLQLVETYLQTRLSGNASQRNYKISPFLLDDAVNIAEHLIKS